MTMKVEASWRRRSQTRLISALFDAPVLKCLRAHIMHIGLISSTV